MDNMTVNVPDESNTLGIVRRDHGRIDGPALKNSEKTYGGEFASP